MFSKSLRGLRWRLSPPLKKTSMYLDDFSDILLRYINLKVPIIWAYSQLQENQFLVPLKTPQNMALCTEASEFFLIVDSGVTHQELIFKLGGRQIHRGIREKSGLPRHTSPWHRERATHMYDGGASTRNSPSVTPRHKSRVNTWVFNGAEFKNRGCRS